MQTLQSSNAADPPHCPSQSCIHGLFPDKPPTQFPQLSENALPPQSLLQSWEHGSWLVSPPTQTPQLSIYALPNQILLQSCWHEVLSFSAISSHTPHSSVVALPFGAPEQSVHVELSPAHIPHSSVLLVEQSGSSSLLFAT